MHLTQTRLRAVFLGATSLAAVALVLVAAPPQTRAPVPLEDAVTARDDSAPVEAEADRARAAPPAATVLAAPEIAAAPAPRAGLALPRAELRPACIGAECSSAPSALGKSVASVPPTLAPGDQFATAPRAAVLATATEPVSTFSVDVDTASYAYVRRALNDGALPPPQAVRIEEMVNYFDYAYPAADGPVPPFRADLGLMPTPWNPDTLLLRIGIAGYEPPVATRPRANLVFLVDTSGSMQDADKLPLLTAALRLLVNQLGPDDRVGIVAYAGSAGVVLEPTGDRAAILDALGRLEAGGGTAGAEGIEAAYALAQRGFDPAGVNRVILATDGDFNVGPSDADALERLIADKRASGVMLSVLGFGRGNLNDVGMQRLAQHGNGQAAYIDTLAEAQKVLVEDAGATRIPIASDVKIQVEFNPARVAEYRLIGYETRALATADFNNDRVDAGDIAAGHQVTALYELTPVGSPARTIDPLRYGAPQPDGGPELGFLKIRAKTPGAADSTLWTTPITDAARLDPGSAAAAEARFAAAVAAFGQLLTDSPHLGAFGFDDVLALARDALGADPYGHRAEFLSLVRLAAAM